MAIDTAEKRKSITGIHLYAAGPGVTPNVAKDAEWRKEAGYSYPLTAAPPPAGAVTIIVRLGQGLAVDSFDPSEKIILVGGRRRLGGR